VYGSPLGGGVSQVKETLLYCSFCGKSQHEVAKLIAGPSVCICDECVELCGDIILEEKKQGSGGEAPPSVEAGAADAPPPPRLAFLFCPTGKPYDRIFGDVIRPAVEAAGFTVERANEVFGARPGFEDLWNRISSATIVVADVTGSDPGVMYELGMAHAVGVPAMLIAQRTDAIPFYDKDRCVIYSDTPRGHLKLADQIKKTLDSVPPRFGYPPPRQ